MTGIRHETEPTRLESRVDDSGATILRIVGRLDIESAAAVWNTALKAVPGKGEAILDASGITSCDGAGISLIHDLAHRQRIGGGTLEVRDLRQDFQSLLELSHLEDDLAVEPPAPERLSLPEIVGTRTVELCDDLRSLLRYVGAVCSGLLWAVVHPRRVRWGDVLHSCTVAGAFALPVVALIGFLLGWVLAFSSAFIMKEFGAEQFLGRLIGPAMIRELGPLMTCVVLAARSGSAFAAEIGTMKVNEEIDALTTMGLDPVRFLVTPKMVAAVLMTPLLAAFAALAGIVGGGLVSTFILGQPLVVYTNDMQLFVGVPGVILGLIKSMAFGVIVAAVGCIRGMQTLNSPSAVGLSTTSAVVTSIVFLAITDAVLAVVVQILDI